MKQEAVSKSVAAVQAYHEGVEGLNKRMPQQAKEPAKP